MGLIYVHKSKAVPQPAEALPEDTVIDIEADDAVVDSEEDFE